MLVGEILQLNFIVSQKLSRSKRKSFDARFFLGASSNENVGGFLLRKDRWKNLMNTKNTKNTKNGLSIREAERSSITF